jgi:hypothetical protein
LSSSRRRVVVVVVVAAQRGSQRSTDLAEPEVEAPSAFFLFSFSSVVVLAGLLPFVSRLHFRRRSAFCTRASLLSPPPPPANLAAVLLRPSIHPHPSTPPSVQAHFLFHPFLRIS